MSIIISADDTSHIFEIHPDDGDSFAGAGGGGMAMEFEPIDVPTIWLVPFDDEDPAESEDPGESYALREDANSSRVLFKEQVIYSLNEHVAALDGPGLDPVHLYLRSEIDPEKYPHHPEIVAAIIKARCDFHYWVPLLDEGRAGRFNDYCSDLQTSLAALERNLPPGDKEELTAAWDQAWKMLNDGLPAQERHRGITMADIPGLH